MTTSCFPSTRSGPTTSARFSFAAPLPRAVAHRASARRARRTPRARAPPRGCPAAGRSRRAPPRPPRVPRRRQARESSRASSDGARTRRGRCGGPPRHPRRRDPPKATSAESTFGNGLKAVRATGWKPVRPRGAGRAGHAPYAFVPGSAKKRSATSRCTITHHDRSVGAPQAPRRSASRRCTGGSRRAWSASARGIRVEGERVTEVQVTFVRSPMASRSAGSSDRSSSTAWTCRTRSARKVVSTPRPGPTSSETSVGSRRASRSMTPSRLAVDQEVLAERALRRDGPHGRSSPNAAVALASIRASSSSGDSFRASAKVASV